MTMGRITGVVLAGGQGRRAGYRAKALLELAGKPLIEHVLVRLLPQVDGLAISANQDIETLRAYGHPVLQDETADAGPLAGILVAMAHARAHGDGAQWLLSAAVDTPFFPQDYGARLLEGATSGGAGMAAACSHGRLHPVFALWPLAQYDALRQAVLQEGERRLGRWLERQNCARVDFGAASPDPFFNINSMDDLQQAARML